MQIKFLPFLALAFFQILSAQTVAPFELKNVDGNKVSTASYSGRKGVVVIFTGNHCVYSKKYEDRIIAMHRQFQASGIQFVLVNSNNPATSEEESFEQMVARSKEKGYPFPYLQDPDRKVAKLFSATRNPEVFLMVPEGANFRIVYKGNIDDNALMPDKVSNRYLEDAIKSVIAGQAPAKAATDPLGCSIREM